MTTLYEKRGRRYVPVADERKWDSWPQGFHLIYVKPGSRAAKFSINPDRAGLLAALQEHEKLLLDKMSEAAAITMSSNRKVTREQKQAWDALNQALDYPARIEYPALQDIYRALLKAVEELA